MLTATYLGGTQSPVKRTSEVKLTIRVPDGTLLDRVTVAVAQDADPSTFSVTVPFLNDLALEYLGTLPLTDAGDPVPTGRLAIFGLPSSAVESGTLPSRVKLEADGGTNPAIILQGAGMLHYASTYNGGVTKVSSVNPTTNANIALNAFMGVLAGSMKRIEGKAVPEQMPVVSTPDTVPSGGAAILDDTLNPPRQVYRSAAGDLWYGPAFSVTP